MTSSTVSTVLGSLSLGVDIGADGSWEYLEARSGNSARRTIRQALPIEWGGAIPVRLQFESLAASSNPFPGISAAELRIEFVPAGARPASIRRETNACGTDLFAHDRVDPRMHHLRFTVQGGEPSPAGALVFGLRRGRFPLPGSSCELLIQPVQFVGIPRVGGVARLEFSLPAPVPAALVRAQWFWFARSGAASSNVLALQFAD